MLQQTQVARVVPKFNKFVVQFPDEATLAGAPLADVLVAWQGLGYNRRAKFLHQAAQEIVRRGAFPQRQDELMTLPGVGKNTAGAIMAYACNQPSIFVETNVRTVYMHHFFAGEAAVSDAQITDLLEQTIDRDQPRRFYQNLMDYGAWLKANGVRINAQSRHYKKQSPLAGSVRQVRGHIIARLAGADQTLAELRQALGPTDERLPLALDSLLRDGLVEWQGDRLRLTN